LLANKVQLAIASGDPQEYELRVEHPAGREVHVRAVAVPSKDAQGQAPSVRMTVVPSDTLFL
jgi:hypothetical protein